MRLLGIDFESTGVDTSKDRITEMGVVLWDTETKRPLMTVGMFLHDDTYPPQSPEVIRVTGITDGILQEFGTAPAPNFAWLEAFCQKHKVGYLCAHNAQAFDRPLLTAELVRSGGSYPTLLGLPWVDTIQDIPFTTEPDSKKLKHLATDHGFLFPFSHRAIFDVLAMLKILSNYAIEDILEYQKIPFVTMRAMVNYDNKELAKAQRYSWEKIGTKTFAKQWVKRIKQNLLPLEIETCKKAGFQIVQVE